MHGQSPWLGQTYIPKIKISKRTTLCDVLLELGFFVYIVRNTFTDTHINSNDPFYFAVCSANETVHVVPPTNIDCCDFSDNSAAEQQNVSPRIA